MQFTPNVAFFVFGMVNGYTFGEAAWASQRGLSWENTVIGDPLYQPAKIPLPQLHASLAKEKNPLIEWSFERLANLDLVRGLRPQVVENFLESIPATGHSAVLTEKLADLNDLLGKPSSAIDAWRRALDLDPSPQQRIQLHLILGEKLAAAGREADVADNLRQFVADSPDYPGMANIREKLKALEQKPAPEKK
jgi:tetratricopeptide (TPR) repeat protein